MTCKLSPHHQSLYDAGDEQRKLCHDWLVSVMSESSEKTRTKGELCAEAIERFRTSKSAFERAWITAIEETGNHHWFKPVWRPRKHAGVREFPRNRSNGIEHKEAER